jgi:hypothetical protein
MKKLDKDRLSEKQKIMLKWSNEKLVLKIINLQEELKHALNG